MQEFKSKNGRYLVCEVFEDKFIPEGNGKSLEFCKEILKSKKFYRPRADYRIFKLIQYKGK